MGGATEPDWIAQSASCPGRGSSRTSACSQLGLILGCRTELVPWARIAAMLDVVDTRNGTRKVRTMCTAVPGSMLARNTASPWLMATRTVPTIPHVTSDRLRTDGCVARASQALRRRPEERKRSNPAVQGATISVPTMPCPRCPSTGQKKVYVPAESVTEIDSDCPGW